jgi:hypothetical protein
MKLSKTSLIVLIVGILVIAAAFLGWIYSQQLDQQKQIETQLTAAKTKLASIKLDDLNQQKEQATQQIEQLNALLLSNKDRLKAPEDSIDATRIILEDARNHNIDIQSMTSTGQSSQKFEGTSLNALSIDVEFTGYINDIANFAVSLNEIFPTSIENLVQISRLGSNPTPTPAGTPTPTPTPTVLITPVPPGFTPIVSPEKDFSGSLSLVIYNYEGN